MYLKASADVKISTVLEGKKKGGVRLWIMKLMFKGTGPDNFGK